MKKPSLVGSDKKSVVPLMNGSSGYIPLGNPRTNAVSLMVESIVIAGKPSTPEMAYEPSSLSPGFVIITGGIPYLCTAS